MEQLQYKEVWVSGDDYELYVGRWSRIVARKFLKLLKVPPFSRWLDIGCGTGMLSETILEVTSAREVQGIDRSVEYVKHAKKKIQDERVRFEVGDASNLPYKTAAFDAAVSGLVLNFIPAPLTALIEMTRVVHNGGTVALYVWDYADQMQMIKYFWDAAVNLDPAAVNLDEGRRFTICAPGQLEQLFRDAGLTNIEVFNIDISTHFRDFDDYWLPFLGGQGPAPGYIMSLDQRRRIELREQIRSSLPTKPDGSIHLIARAWAAFGIKI